MLSCVRMLGLACIEMGDIMMQKSCRYRWWRLASRPEHPNTLTSMANLASTYWNQGRWKEAEELEVQVMETRKQVLGSEHPSTLTSTHNLAYTWESLGKINDALMLMEKCVELRTKLSGPDHPYTLSSSKALSKWLQAKGSSPAKPSLIVGQQESDQYSPNLLGHYHLNVPSSDCPSVELASQPIELKPDSAKHPKRLFFKRIFRRG
ncbi:hypothetical protein BDV26DRAFT_125608 [Aspergillus bertholletiae]|uniref:Tetratricopeptide repeat-domain-containing protein n=1 Tax=Aspergillus bertholletiae TaxID=1226010 RepID=A0A5N7AQE8_9EURO|nr:hypothetical protein BDV26DRAFT_125608 [Aspergillus bertholletiae]